MREARGAMREPTWKYVVVSVFLGMIGSMTIGGLWSAFRMPNKDAVLAGSFAGVFAISLALNLRKRPNRPT
jgi:hypothetical protein